MEEMLMFVGICLLAAVLGLVVGRRTERAKHTEPREEKSKRPALFMTESFAIPANIGEKVPAYVAAYIEALESASLTLPEGEFGPEDIGGEYCANMVVLDAVKRMLLEEYIKASLRPNADGSVQVSTVALDNLARNTCALFTWLWEKSKP